MPRQYSQYYLRKKSLKPIGFYKKKVKGRKGKVTVPIMPRVARRKVQVASVLPHKKPSVIKRKTVLPRDVMEERIISISRTHLDPMDQQNLQDNLRKANDEQVEGLYKYWSKKGKKKEVKVKKAKKEKKLKIPSKPKRAPAQKMTHIERMHLLATCKKFELDPQEIDNEINYYENKKHLQELASEKGFTEAEITSGEQEQEEWVSQFKNYLNQLKGELESAGYEVRERATV